MFKHNEINEINHRTLQFDQKEVYFRDCRLYVSLLSRSRFQM